MKIRYLNLSVKNKTERSEYLDLFEEFLKSGQFVGGPALTNYKSQLAAYFQQDNISLCSSGTSALYLAAKALGLKAGDEVIMPCLSFYASANAFSELGIKCVFADIKEDLTISTDSIENLITSNTKAIVPVHFMGKTCDMKSISAIAKKHKLFIIEDASQAFGTRYNGKLVGTFGDIGCFSTNCMKLLAGMGDSGFILSNSLEIAEIIDELSYNGMSSNKECKRISINHRIDPLQCLILSKRLKDIDSLIAKRRKIYNNLIKSIPLESLVTKSESEVVYGLTLKLDNRSEFEEYLTANNIEFKIEHSPLISQLEIYKDCKAESKNGEKLVKKIINIPCHENLNNDELVYLSEKLENFFKGSSKSRA